MATVSCSALRHSGPIPAVALEQESSESEQKSYFIGSGDILELITWKEPDFSRDVLVRIDGMITFPLLDDIRAAGRTTMDIKNQIQEELKEYIKSPFVTVSVKGYGSQKYYVLGEVNKTGEYNLVKGLTVLQAFALAQGFTEWALKKEIILIRREYGRDKIIRVNYKDIIKGQGLEQNVLIKANDTIIVP
ncbi:MAG: polysaccharide export protein [Desulfobacteraceae bacterium]|nr:polysaccharide export protein [Desulfobacteraceae bacterium]